MIPPQNTALEPETDVIALPTPPPVHDSAVPHVFPSSVNRFTSFSAVVTFCLRFHDSLYDASHFVKPVTRSTDYYRKDATLQSSTLPLQ